MKQHLCLVVALLIPIILVIPTPVSLAGNTSIVGLKDSNSSQSDDNQLVGSSVFEKLTARLIGNRVQLAWRMNTALEVAYFAIEKSGNDHLFGFVGGLNLNKSVSSQEAFRFVDLQEPPQASAFYRIKLVLSDGNKIYSSPVQIEKETDVSIYLDPASDILSLIPTPQSTHPFTAQIFDRVGNPVLSATSAEQAEKIQISMGHLSDGLYVIRIQTGNKVLHKRILKR